MFNTIKLGSNSQTVNLNTPCTGILQRSHPKSIFVRFQKDSKMEDWVFNSEKPYIKQYESHQSGYDKYRETYGKVHITVLQVLIFGDNQYLVEVLEDKFLNQSEISL